MAVVKLTRRLVRNSRCEHGRKLDLFDSVQRGLVLEVRQTGRKTYYARYTNGRGSERHIRIGPADVINLAQARSKARTVMAAAILGHDPQEDRKELRRIPRFEDFARSSFLPFLRISKRSWKTDETMLRCHVLPRLGRMYLDEIEAEHVSSLLDQMKTSGYASGTINRALVVVRYSLKLARKWGKLPTEAPDPTASFRPAPDIERQIFLSKEEIARLLDTLTVDPNQNAANAIRLLLLTGARRNEVLQARWEDVDVPNRHLRVPMSKSNRVRHVYLNESAIQLLNGLPRSNEFIFALKDTGRPPASLFFPWARIRKRADLEGVRLHDLRHTFASVLVNEGVSLFVVQKLLGHAHPKATQRYAHLSQDTLQEAAALFQRSIADPASVAGSA